MKYLIVIKGTASTDHKNLKELDGIDCQDDFAEYFDDDFSFKNAIDSGYMAFSYKDGELYTVTTYESDRELTSDELKELEEYTTGQWSDGIGEGFEQNPCREIDDEEIYISPWHLGQKVTTTQTLLD